jgi:hypothetical protein
MQEYDYIDMQEGGISAKPKELKLVNSGAFGCIYSPNLTCNGNIGSINYITKIQKSKRSIKHELRISEKIRKIVGYARYFAPVLSSCNVRIEKDRLDDLKKCDVFKDESVQNIKSSSYISLKIRYVGDNDLKKYLFSNTTSIYIFIEKLWTTHFYLLKSIQKLFANKILHYDLKYNNIILDKKRNVPIIIDFGQSWAIDELQKEDEINAAFFVFDQYDYWCLDILICNYVIQIVGITEAKTKIVTDTEIEKIYDVFIYGKEPNYENGTKKILNDVYRYGILQNPDKLQKFKDTMDKYTKKFIHTRTWWELYEDLLNYSNTWDCYSLSVIYLNMLDDVFLSQPVVYNKMMNPSLQKYIGLMEQILYNIPNERPPVQYVEKELDTIMRQYTRQYMRQ